MHAHVIERAHKGALPVIKSERPGFVTGYSGKIGENKIF